MGYFCSPLEIELLPRSRQGDLNIRNNEKNVPAIKTQKS